MPEASPDTPSTTPPRAKHVEAAGGKDDLKNLPLADVEKRLASSPEGLTAAEATKRLAQ
jgi:H+-transporting ATPase